MQVHRGPTCGHLYTALLQPDQKQFVQDLKTLYNKTPKKILNMPTDIEVITFPWISYLMEPSNSAPKAMSFVTVVLMSVTVNDSKEEYPFCTG